MQGKEVFDNRPCLSVIVPVFNIKEQVVICLESLSAQKIRDIEIIVVDDGSTDSSGEICDIYAEHDSRFKVFHQKNAGLSAARNAGVERARGKYLMFVDGDDWVEPDFCSTAYSLAEEKQADLVIFAYRRITDRKIINYRQPLSGERVLTEADIVELFPTTYGTLVWNKLYHKRLFENIRFPMGRVYEDIGTTYKLLCIAKTIYHTDKILYNWRKREGSIGNKHTLRSENDRYEMALLKANDLVNWGYNISEDQLMWYVSLMYLKYIGAHGRYSSRCGDCLKNSKEYRNASGRIKLMVRVYHFSPTIFHFICKIRGKQLS